MQGSLLRFYVHEYCRVHQQLVWEWLLRQAEKLNLHGGVAMRCLGACGREHGLRERQYFEGSASLTVQVEFIVTDEEARRLLELVEAEHLRVFYVRTPAQFGVLNETPVRVAASA